MSYYINNPQLFNILTKPESIKLILNKIESYGHYTKVEVIHKDTPDELILLQAVSKYGHSNIVVFLPFYKNITINPISDKKTNNYSVMSEFANYLNEIPEILRDIKIDTIIND